MNSQKVRLANFKRQQCATIIQASWRGSKTRKLIRYKIEMKNSVLPSEAGDTGEVSDQEDEGLPEEVKDLEETKLMQVAEQDGEHVIKSLLRTNSIEVNKWPTPLTESFSYDTRPRIDDCADAVVENWVVENKKVLIRLVTWNLCAKKPPDVKHLESKLLPKNRFHLYVIGSEECERSIAHSAINPSKRHWEAYIKEALGPSYMPLRSQTLQAIHIIVFAHTAIAHLCSDVSSAAVATGVGNTLGNKGGVGISMNIGSTRFAFFNAHFAAHQNAVKRRNLDFKKISKAMPPLLLKKDAVHLQVNRIGAIDDIGKLDSRLDSQSHKDIPTEGASGATRFHASIDKCADRIFFMGDLNYRIRGNRSLVSKLLEMEMHDVMLNNDQLKWSMARSLAFENFVEPPLNFRPTYKLDIGADTYDSGSKQRIPAWADRILYVKSDGLSCTAYDSDTSLKTSDHRPVFASFEASIDISADSNERVHPTFTAESQVCSMM